MTEMTRTQFAVAAVLVVAVVLLGSRVLGSPGAAPASQVPASSTTPAYSGERGGPGAAAGAAVDPPPAGGRLYVHVAGRVRRPGLYRLRPGSRIADAVKRAGGRAKHADLDAINLAAKLHDGDQVLVPLRASVGAAPVGTAAPAAGGAGAAPTAVISLNTATAEQLETIDGVGPATAEKILAFRKQNGSFRSVEDLAQISGIGPKRLEAMRPHVRV